MKRYEIHLAYDGDRRVPYQWAYQFYGALMQNVDAAYAGRLHESSFTPVHQFLTCSEPGSCLWTVNLLNGEAVEQFSAALERMDRILLQPQDILFRRTSIAVSDSEDEAELPSANEPEQHLVRLHFLTPTAFKSAGEYVYIPNLHLILQSMVNRREFCETNIRLDDEDALRMLLEGLRIRDYSLRTSRFPLKSTVMRGFIGHVDVYDHLPVPLKLVWLQLLNKVPFYGVGIKTSLGMGAIRIESPQYREKQAGMPQRTSE